MGDEATLRIKLEDDTPASSGRGGSSSSRSGAASGGGGVSQPVGRGSFSLAQYLPGAIGQLGDTLIAQTRKILAVAKPAISAAVGSGGASAASGTATGMTAATGSSRVLAVAGKALGAVGIAAGAAAVSLYALDRAVMPLVNDLKGFSGALAASVARGEAQTVIRNVQRGREMGADLARYNDARNRLGFKIQEITDKILQFLIKIGTPMLEGLERLVTWAQGVGESVSEALKVILEYMAEIPGIGASARILLDTWSQDRQEARTAEIFSGMEDAFDVMLRFVQADPFEPMSGGAAPGGGKRGDGPRLARAASDASARGIVRGRLGKAAT